MIQFRNSKFVEQFWNIAGGVSVRTKIFGIVLGSTLLLSIVFILQIRTSITNVLIEKNRQQAISIARDISARATDLILINDLYSLHQLLDETVTNFPDVRYIFILDQDNNVLVHTFSNGFPTGLIEANHAASTDFHNTVLVDTNEGRIWDVAVPIFQGKLGTTRLGISEQNLRQTISSLSQQMLVTILIVVLFSLLASTFLTWLLTRPILELVKATEKVAQGDFSIRISRWANDEIGALADAFNNMIMELSKIEELRRERENLRLKLLQSVISAQEEERKRIARELHDSTSQSLTSLKVGISALENTCQCIKDEKETVKLKDIIDKTLDEIHYMAIQLRPTVLDDLGLEPALERLINDWRERHQVYLDILIDLGPTRLPSPIETALYRITQEALTNIARHAKANAVSIILKQQNGEVIAVFEDNGIGFDINKVHKGPHLGLVGIRERTELLGGTLHIETEPGTGTSIIIRIPILPAAER